MNNLTRYFLTYVHRKKFAKLGKKCLFPVYDLHVSGHVEMGNYCRMRNNATLRTYGAGKIVFGNRSGLSWGVTVEARERVEFGDFTAVAEYSYITDTWYDCFGNEAAPEGIPKRTAPVIIGNNCFIGSGCIITPGVRIGDGAVIGNQAIVTRDVGPLEIWMGAPARKMAHRIENVPERKMQEFEALARKYGIKDDRYLRYKQQFK